MQIRTMLLVTCLIPSLIATAQDAKTDSERNGKIVDYYNDMITKGDIDSAEVLAIGFKSKFGDNKNVHEICTVMLIHVQLARDAQNQNYTAYRSPPIRTLPVRAFKIQDLPARCRLGDDSDSYEQKNYLRLTLGYGGNDIKVVPNENFDAVVVTGSASARRE